VSRAANFVDRLCAPFAKRERSSFAAARDPARLAETARPIAIALCIGVLLAASAAVGTDAWPLWRRFAYWLPLVVLVTALGLQVAARVQGLPERLPHPVLEWLAITALLSVPGALIVWGYTGVWGGFAFGPELLLGVLGPTVVINAIMTALIMLADRPGPQTHARSPTTEDTGQHAEVKPASG
jgi:hypothetical protein